MMEIYDFKKHSEGENFHQAEFEDAKQSSKM